ncbi:hypothetical protein AB0J72_41585 [Dactylosporangium sp. NPDC049742]|uniref:hypothetical protein n=1 Tax=Dactylosporangium sp. NPDC049742 TaxID=3154737 RepID=UPI00341B0119
MKLPWLALALATVALPLALGTSPLDVVRYAGYFVYAVVVPGTLLYRAIRPTPRSLLEDLTYGTVAGLLAETAFLTVASLLDLRGWLWAWPLLVIVPLARFRKHPCYPDRPTAAWSWAVAGIAAGFLAYLTAAFLAVNPALPTGGAHDYMIDQLNLLAVSADLKHHFPLTVPEQGDRTLGYHWFAYGHVAASSLISGVDLPVVWFRLDLPVLAVLAVCLLAVTGRRVAGHPWAGPVAAALMFTVGELVPQQQTPAFFGSITAYYSWSSRSLLFGAALSMPLIAAVVSVLRGGGRRDWLLVLLFAAGTTGAKSTIVPLFGAGVAAVCAVHLLRRRPQRTPWLLGALLAAVTVGAVAVLYGFEGQGLRWGPFAIMLDFVGSQRHGTTVRDVPLILWGLGAYGIAMGARLAGVLLLRRWDDACVFLAGTTAAGVAGTLCVWHVSWSEHFFVVAAWPCAAILSATGLVRLPGSPRALWTALAAAAALAAVSVAFTLPVPRHRWWVPLPVYALGALVLVAALLLHRRAGVFGALVVVLFAGAARLPFDAATNANLGVAYHIRITPDQVAGARWLRAHSTPAEYVATNVHRVGGSGLMREQSLAYWISAYSERRVLLGSWGYSPESTESQSRAHRIGPALAYWDPERLALNDAAVLDPTPSRLSWLWRQRVRWILVDRAHGTPAAALPALTDLAWQRGDVAVYRLRAPSNCTPVSCSDSVQSR